MSALDDALAQAEFGSHPDMDIAPAWAELAQLRADLQAARDERDEAKAWHISLNAMIDRKNATIEKQAWQLDEAHSLIDQSCSDAVAIVNMSDGYVHEMAEHLANQLGEWLAANPAPSPEPPRCTCGTGDAIMPEYHAAYCILKAEPQP